MIVVDPDYRADPRRAIFVQGVIGPELVERVTEQIVGLQHTSRDPITVYIDSPGGSVLHKDRLIQLLRAPTQDTSRACRIITAVTGRAASAAADLLAAGDYAIAYPSSSVLFHGVRTTTTKPITAEAGTALAEELKSSNERFAMALARDSEERFMFRYATSKSEFSEIRAKHSGDTIQDLDCFLILLREKISSDAASIVAKAHARYLRYNDLLTRVLKRSTSLARKKTVAQIEGFILKDLVDFEIRSNKEAPEWRFSNGGMSSLGDDLLLLNEYIRISSSDQFKRVCTRWERYALSEADKQSLAAISDSTAREQKVVELVRPQFQPVWSFFVALCHVLQEGENGLTASDAFWLGLVDEVVGSADAVTLRFLMEWRADPAPVPAAASA